MPKGIGYGGKLRPGSGNPRQKLRDVMTQSGVSDSSAVKLEREAFGTAGKASKKRMKKKKQQQKKSLRSQIIMRLREIGEKAKNLVT